MLALGAAGLTLVFQAVLLRLTFEVICQMPEEKHETTAQTKAAGLKPSVVLGSISLHLTTIQMYPKIS